MGLSESQLRRQGLLCLVSVLRSLVAWGTGSKATDEGAPPISARSITDERRESNSEATPERLSGTGSLEAIRQVTPDIADDPSRFESAKQKKTTLLEGIKKFNFRPKRVCSWIIEVYFIHKDYRAWSFCSKTGLLRAERLKTLQLSFSSPMASVRR